MAISYHNRRQLFIKEFVFDKLNSVHVEENFYHTGVLLYGGLPKLSWPWELLPLQPVLLLGRIEFLYFFLAQLFTFLLSPIIEVLNFFWFLHSHHCFRSALMTWKILISASEVSRGAPFCVLFFLVVLVDWVLRFFLILLARPNLWLSNLEQDRMSSSQSSFNYWLFIKQILLKGLMKELCF